MAITINGSSEITSAGVKNYTLSYGSGERVNGIFISTNNRDQKYLANYNRVGDELQLTFPDIDTGFDGVTFTINAYGVDSGGNAIYGSKSVKYYRYNEYGSSGTDYQVFSSGDTVTIGFCGPSDFDVEFTSNLMTITDQTITPNIPRSSAGFYRTATFTILSADKNATYTATVKKNGTTVYTRVFHFNVKYSSNITLTTNWYNGSSISRYNESFGSKLIYDGDSLYIDGRLQTVNLSVNRPSGTSVSSIVVSKDVSWISINRVMSALMVTVNANNTGNTRSGVITVTINNYSMSFTITQSKSGFSVAGDVNPAGGLLLSDATGYSTPTVNAPSSSLPNWITSSSSNFTASANSGNVRESELIDFILNDPTGSVYKYTVYSKIYQLAAPLVTAEATKTVPKAAGTVFIDIDAIRAPSLTGRSNANWLTSSTSNVGGFAYTANTTGSNRTATITWYVTINSVETAVATTTVTQLGADPEIKLTPASGVLNATEPTIMYVVKYPEGYSLTWSATGTVSINSSSTYFEDVDSTTKRLYVVTNNNTSRNTLTSTITVTGTKDGDTLVGTATLTKNGTPGSISISPSSKTVNPTSGTVTYDVTCVDMNLSTLRTNVYDSTMNNVTASINSAGTVLTVNYGANTATSSKSASISVYGDDIYGFGKSAGVTLNQKASVTVSLSPSTKTIGNTEQTADFAVSCSPSGATLSYNVASGGTLGIDTTRTGFITSGGTKYLRVYTNANTSTSTQSASITVTGTYDGVTGTSSAVTLSKQGVPGTITLDPTTATINAAAGTLTVGVTPFNMNTSSITFSVASGNLTISSVSFNSTKTQATISYAANTSTTSEKSGVITIYGNDVYGARASANITITQKKAVPTITVTPSSGTLTATESPIVYVVSYPSGYTNLNYTTSGDISINRTEFETVDSTTSRFWVYVDQNTSTSSKVNTFRVTVPYYGETIQSNEFTLTQQGIPGYVTVTPETRSVSGAASSTTFTVDPVRMNNSTLQTNIYDNTMTNVTATLNSAKTLLTVSYGANNSNSNKSAKVSVYGNDIYGYGRNDYVTITQRPAVSVSLSPSTSTIPNTQENTQFGVTYSPSGASLSYTVVSGSDLIDTTRTRFIDSGGAKYLIVYTNSNTGTSAKTATINVTATNSGDSVTSNTVTVTKQGTAGTITLNPSSVTVGADAGSTSVGITTSNMNLSTLSYTVSSSSTMTINGVTFNSDKTQATISYAANNSTSAEKSATITISGTDVWGYSTSATVTLTQRKARPTLSVSPDSATLTATESPVMFVVQHTAGVTLAYTVSGDIVIDSTSFESVDSTVSRFWIYPHPNASTTSKVSTFRITTSYYGETVQSNQFTLTQQGVPGYVSLSPNTATVNGASGTVEFDITKYQMQDNTLATNIYDNTMNNVVASFNAEKTKLIVTYGANTGSSDLSAKVSVYGLDIYGYNRNDYVTITQKAQGTIAFNPATKTVGYLSDTTSMALVLNNVDPSTITVSSNESWAIPTFNTSTRQVSIYYLDNWSESPRSTTLTATGTDTYGVTITQTATFTQNSAGDITIVLSPDSRTLDYQEQECSFTVVATEGLVLSYRYVSGDISLNTSRTGVISQGNVITFRVSTNDNTTGRTQTGVFVVQATAGGTTYQSNEVTVYKTGVPGTITITPNTAVFPATSGSTTFEVATTNINTATMGVNVYEDTIGIVSATLNNDRTALTVEWPASASTSTKSAKISVSGQDLRGLTIAQEITVTQGGAEPYLRINPNTYSVLSRAGSVVFTIEHFGIDPNYTVTTSGDMVGTISVDRTTDTVTYTYLSNTTSSPKTGQVIVSGVNEDQQQLVAAAVITQASGVVSSISPIWNTVELAEDPLGSFTEYHIELDNSTIYAAKAYKYPGETLVKFSINDIASNYLGNGLSFTEGCREIPDYTKVFDIITSDGTNYSQTFYNSWAYKDTDYWLSDPIDYKVSCKQWLPVSFLTTYYASITVNNTPYSGLLSDTGYTVMQNLRNAIVGNEIVVYGANGATRRYKIDDADYVLYYANAYGGWDSLLCNGTSRKTDNIETLSYRKKSSSLSDFSKVDYQKIITPTWSLNTGIIWNGEKMYHLLESTMVYLHNLKTNEIIPVVITNSSCDYLNYTNNGKQPVRYNITVEESNTKIRK